MESSGKNKKNGKAEERRAALPRIVTSRDASRYIVENGAGWGGQALVFRARRVSDGVRVALKVLTSEAQAEHSLDDSFAERFSREAALMAILQHPNIARCYGSGEVALDGEQKPFIVLEFIPGRTLEVEIVERCCDAELLVPLPRAEDEEQEWRLADPSEYGQRLERPLFSLSEIFAIVKAVLEALAYLHRLRGYIGGEEMHAIHHRDVKPANIIVQRNAERQVIRTALLDLGIARISSGIADLIGGPRTLTNTDSFIGSIFYMSPEQMKTPSLVGAQTDIYSVGAILFVSLTGRRLFSNAETVVDYFAKIINSSPEDPRKYADGIPDVIAEIVMKAMARDPADRYADAAEMLTAWNAAAEELLNAGAASKRVASPAGTRAGVVSGAAAAPSVLVAASAPSPRRSVGTKPRPGHAATVRIVAIFAAIAGLIIALPLAKHFLHRTPDAVTAEFTETDSEAPSSPSGPSASAMVPPPGPAEPSPSGAASMRADLSPATLGVVRQLCIQVRLMRRMRSSEAAVALARVRTYSPALLARVRECRGL